MKWKLKLDRLLAELSTGKASAKTNESLEKLTFLLQKQESEEVDAGLISDPTFGEWIREVVTTWDSNAVTPSSGVAAFALSLASLLSKNEEVFCRLRNLDNFYSKLAKVTTAEPKTTLAYISLLSSFLSHKSGIEWMTSRDCWEDVYSLALREGNEEVAEESSRFMSTMLTNAIGHDESFCSSVVEKIMAPLNENIYMDFCTETVSWRLKATLRLISGILCHCMERVYNQKEDFRVLFAFLKHFHSGQRVPVFSIVSHRRRLPFDFAKILFVMQFLELYVKIVTYSVSGDEMKTLADQLRKCFFSVITRENYEDIVDFCNFGILYWNLFESRIPIADTSFSKQLIIMLVVPNWISLRSNLHNSSVRSFDYPTDDQIREIFAKNVLKTTSNDLIRICYGLRDSLIGNPDLYKICCRSLSLMKKSRRYFPVGQAVLIFQIFLYTIKDIVTSARESPEKLAVFLKQPQYVTEVFEIVRIFVEQSRVKWNDSCETIEVIPLCLDFLAFSEFPAEVVVEILKLVKVAIVNYLTPNLALLLDDIRDSSMSFLGPLLYSKLRDNEVKLTALEVIHTIATFSSSKFPSLHEVLTASGFPSLLMKMSVADDNSLVRSAAIKCLQEMVQVDQIWNKALKAGNLLRNMLSILLNDPESIVRAEAATFVCVAYEHQRFADDSLGGIHEAMIYKVIQSLLHNQGMIDGTFPCVTFSREHRKIVALTDAEVRKRLLRVLRQLSATGCLGVVVAAIRVHPAGIYRVFKVCC